MGSRAVRVEVWYRRSRWGGRRGGDVRHICMEHSLREREVPMLMEREAEEKYQGFVQ